MVNRILKALKVASVELLTNNPLKVDAITAIPVAGVRALRPPAFHDHHLQYLQAKQQRENDVLQRLLQNGLAPNGPKAHLAEMLAAIVSRSPSASASLDGSDAGCDEDDVLSNVSGNASERASHRTAASPGYSSELHHASRPTQNAVATTTPTLTVDHCSSTTAPTLTSSTLHTPPSSSQHYHQQQPQPRQHQHMDTMSQAVHKLKTDAARLEKSSGKAPVSLPLMGLNSAAATDNKQRMDAALMHHALRLALRGRVSAPPNPWVGCVLVRDGAVIGEGFHHRAGEPHAEVMALTDAAQRYCTALGQVYTAERRAEWVRLAAQGATAYVTLEPCHHFGRTGPCDQALLDAGISRVVVAVVDPDTRVSSQGLGKLRAAGVHVTTGVLAKEVRVAMRPYLHQRRHGRAYCVLKTALSIDGKLACEDGSSQWITGPAARRHAHFLRAKSQAVLVGAGTAVMDLPRLTPRLAVEDLPADDVEGRAQLSERRAQPLLRVVLDGMGRVVTGPLLETAENPTLVFTSSACPPSTWELWDRCGVQHVQAPGSLSSDGKHFHVDVAFVLSSLAQRGVLQVMVEGGAAVHAAFLQSGLVDELHVYFGPKLLGASAKAWPAAPLTKNISDAADWTLAEVQRLDEAAGDVCCVYRRPKSEEDENKALVDAEAAALEQLIAAQYLYVEG